MRSICPVLQTFLRGTKQNLPHYTMPTKNKLQEVCALVNGAAFPDVLAISEM